VIFNDLEPPCKTLVSDESVPEPKTVQPVVLFSISPLLNKFEPGSGVMVRVSVSVGVFDRVGVLLTVVVLERVRVRLGVNVAVRVRVAVGLFVRVGVRLNVGVLVRLGVRLGVTEAVGVEV
jgi:hypothetical protein